MKHSIRNAVVVFDLDDTLYSEADYNTSGFREVCFSIEKIYGKSLAEELNGLLTQTGSDILKSFCRLSGLPESVKESLLWIYRLHSPKITLYPSAQRLISRLEGECQIAILTDGRSITQRKKVQALGLERFPLYISEEYQSEKPSADRFELIMHEIPGAKYYYLADNPKKDFVAPNLLGWITVGVKGGGRNIHSQDCGALPFEYLPSIWISSLDEFYN